MNNLLTQFLYKLFIPTPTLTKIASPLHLHHPLSYQYSNGHLGIFIGVGMGEILLLASHWLHSVAGGHNGVQSNRQNSWLIV